jgi:hypothetical protein
MEWAFLAQLQPKAIGDWHSGKRIRMPPPHIDVSGTAESQVTESLFQPVPGPKGYKIGFEVKCRHI